MKKLYNLIIAALLLTINAWAQPTRNWGTYYGGTGEESQYLINKIVSDANGNVYMVGQTNSLTGISSPGCHQPAAAGGSEAFLVKFNSAGVRQWATYYGGATIDLATAVAVDAAGNVYVAGETDSPTGISTPGCHQPNWAGAFANSDAFLVKFSSAGVRQWGTYYGDDGLEVLASLAVDAAGNAYLCGWTGSFANMATPGAYQTVRNGTLDAYVVKFNTSGVRQWATYYGGPSGDQPNSIAVDASGNVLLSGETSSTTGISTPGSHQPASGGAFDAYLVQFNNAGARQWATYLGGNGADYGYGVTTDASSNIYLTGFTQSPAGISTPGCHQPAFGGVDDGFLQMFNSAGVRQWGTYFGGTAADLTNEVAVDASGKVYITGYTTSTNSISTAGSHQPAIGGLQDAFLVQFNNVGVRQCGTYYGGPDNDYGHGVSVDPTGNVSITGYTRSLTAISTVGAYQPVYGGGQNDIFVAQLVGGGGAGATTATTGIISPATNCAGATISVPFTITGTYVAGNVFTAELSNSVGSFASPIAIGTLVGVVAGTISAVIPANTSPSGSGYKIRVVASSPTTTGSSSSVTINALPIVTISGAAASYCINGADVTLTGNPAGGTFSGAGLVGNIFTPATAGLGAHTITYSYTDANGCSGVATQNINVNAIPTVSFTGLNNAYILADPTVIMTGNPAGGVFSGPGVTGNKFSPSGAGIGTHTIVYIYSDGNGCMNAICQSVTITLVAPVEENKKGDDGGISVFPNPSNGRYTLIFDAQNQAVKIRVINVVGQIIYEESHEQYKGVYNKTIDISKFANGMYSLTVEMNGESYQKSIVKQ